MLRRVLGICSASLLLLAAPVVAQDNFEDPADVLLGPDQDEDTGPDYARDGLYIQLGYTYAIASGLADELNAKKDRAVQAPIDEDQFKRHPDQGVANDGNILLLAVPGVPFDGVFNSVSGQCETVAPDPFPGVYRPCALGKVDVSDAHGVNLRVGRRVLPNLAVELELEYVRGFQVKIPGFSQAAPQFVPPPVVRPPVDVPVGEDEEVFQIDEPVRYAPASDSDKINVDLLSLTVNLKLPLLTGRVQPYLLLGGGVAFTFRDGGFPSKGITPSSVSANPTLFKEVVDVKDTGALFRIGGGIDTYLTEHVYLATEFTYVATQGEKLNDLRYWGVTLGLGYRF